MIVKTKICCCCKIEKDLDEFFNLKASSDGKKPSCKQCARDYYLLNREREIRRVQKRYSEKKVQILAYAKTHYENNKDQYRKNSRNRVRHLRHTNVHYQIKHNLSSQLGLALKHQNATKASRIVQLLGCSIEQFKCYIESLFQFGMSWDNYGKWQLDHKRPTSSFNLSNVEDQKQCFHFTNFQPLWKLDNILKGSFYDNQRHSHLDKFSITI